jgi:ABC-2 type transport system ATP-binding protein
MTNAIVMHNVRKTFGSKTAVNSLDLVVPAGSLCGFIGPNGAGKTTTIRMIMSIIFPDSGEISVLGKPSAIESKDRIGYLPEERGLYKKMKVATFLSYMARLKGIDSSAVSGKVRTWLERVELPDVAKKRCEELSKGMQQKVQFIAAVINEPELLILDEVFSGLDPSNRRLMRSLIEEQHQGGRTIVFSTHAMYEAEQLCDRVFMIHNGVKTLDMSLDELWQAYDPRTVVLEPAKGAASLEPSRFFGLPGVQIVLPTDDGLHLELAPGADADLVIQRAATVGGLRRIELKRASLEDIFINIVGDSQELRENLRSAGVPVAADEGGN